MPSLKRTINGSQWVADPFDQAETDNRNSALSNAWQQASYSQAQNQNDMMARLAMQRLRSDDYRFGQGRADTMAMHREDIGARNHALDVESGLTREGWTHQDAIAGKQFDYQAGRDQAADAWRNKAFDYETNSDLNPDLKTHRDLDSAQAELAKVKLAQMKADAERQQKAGEGAALYTPADAAETTELQALIASGQSPTAAALTMQERHRQKLTAADDSEVGEAASHVGDFYRRDTTAMPAWLGGEADPDDADVQARSYELDKLAEKIAKNENIPLGQARAKVAQAVRAKAPRGGTTADMTELLYKRLGWL